MGEIDKFEEGILTCEIPLENIEKYRDARPVLRDSMNRDQFFILPQSHCCMYDVAVVGQGPAGGMAALRLAEAGHSVVTFDRKRRVGNPVHCGEGLGKIALKNADYPVGDLSLIHI